MSSRKFADLTYCTSCLNRAVCDKSIKEVYRQGCNMYLYELEIKEEMEKEKWKK